jgi:hypothetical protein
LHIILDETETGKLQASARVLGDLIQELDI